MKAVVLIWLQLGICACAGWGQRLPSHPARATALPVGTHLDIGIPSITFLTVPNASPVYAQGADQAVLNLGSLSYFRPVDIKTSNAQLQKDSFLVSTRFGLCITLSNSQRAGTSTVSAFLKSSDPLRNVWVDGIRLSITPGIIGRQIPYGAVTEHVLKMVIPTSMPQGQLLDSIGVIVERN